MNYVKIPTHKDTKVKIEYPTYLTLEPEVYNEIMHTVDKFDYKECSGCGTVKKVDHKMSDGSYQHEFIVSKLFLPMQKNTSTTTDIKAEEVNKIVTDMVMDGKDPSELRFHWHSHADMSVFHSGDDEENYEDLKTGDWLISLVVNKNRDLLARLDYYQPFRLSVTHMPIYVGMGGEALETSELDKQIEAIKENSKIIYGVGGHNSIVKYDAYGRPIIDDHVGMETKDEYVDLYSPTYGKSYCSSDEKANFYSYLGHLEGLGFITILTDGSGTPYGYRDLVYNTNMEVCLHTIDDWEVDSASRLGAEEEKEEAVSIEEEAIIDVSDK